MPGYRAAQATRRSGWSHTSHRWSSRQCVMVEEPITKRRGDQPQLLVADGNQTFTECYRTASASRALHAMRDVARQPCHAERHSPPTANTQGSGSTHSTSGQHPGTTSAPTWRKVMNTLVMAARS